MSLSVYELQQTFDEVQGNLRNEHGLLPENRAELMQTRAELLDELNSSLKSAIGQTVLFKVRFEMLGEPDSDEVVADELESADRLPSDQDALFPITMIKQEGN